MSTQMVSCTLPEKLVAAIDKHVGKTLDSRAQWLRSAIYDRASKDKLLRREANPEDAIEIGNILG